MVLLGEASHGTSEFYRARAAITRRLIERHGFNIVAVEADWPDAATIDRYVRHGRGGEVRATRSSASRPGCGATPTSTPSSAGCGGRNAGRATSAMAGFYGLDLYNLGGSIEAVIGYPRQGRSRGWRGSRAAATAASSRGPTIPQLYGRIAMQRGLCPVRGRAWSRCSRT